MLLELHVGRVQAAFNLENSQMVSLKLKGEELFHGGGKPADLQEPGDAQGWQNSEIVMFPVIGPVKGDLLRFEGREYPMAQHGISRHLPWTIIEQRPDSIAFAQQYEGEMPVPNSKIAVPLRWPHSFTLEKRFSLRPQGIDVTLSVTNDGAEQMRYMIGWHPAFRMLASKVDGMIVSDVQATRAVELRKDAVEFGPLRVSSDLPFMTLWSPKGSSLVCIEPMSRLQVWEGLDGFSEDDFSLAPGERREHRIAILVL